MGKLKASQFKFARNDNVGTEGAEQDRDYLEDCYYDCGDLEILRDCSSNRCLVVGRTGSGKTALLLELQQKEEHAVSIDPEGLSLQYLSNSTILPQLEALGVSLGLFYKLLWRHIFAVELIKAKYGLRTAEGTRTFRDRIWDIFRRDRQREKAMNYLITWGEEFWQDTEYRVQQVTSKLEADVKASLGLKNAVLDASVGGGAKCSVEEKADVVRRIQEVVNSLQVRELTQVIEMLGESVFDSAQPRYYLLLDKLDEGWVEDRFRYRLIKALVETVKEINHQLKGAKIIIAVRRDLLNHVIHETRDSGFQEEKYEPLYLSLKWSKEQLIEILNRRIRKLVHRRYSGAPVSWSDLMPNNVNKQRTDDYLIERTMFRPRDLIVFFNLCIGQAVGKPEITAQMILDAESEYSQMRLRSLYDEWHTEFPELEKCVSILKRLPSRIRHEELAVPSIEELCLTLATEEAGQRGKIFDWAARVTDGRMTPSEFRARLLSVFYQAGLVGLRIKTGTATIRSFQQAQSIPWASIKEESVVFVSPTFWRALGVTPADVRQ